MMKPKQNYKFGPMDDCQTPGYALEPILPWLELWGFYRIWEPACGDGLLVRELERHNFTVRGTDLKTGVDFLDYNHKPDVDCIVTNPPFSIKHLFIEKCVELGVPWFLLVPVEAIGTARVQDALTYMPEDGSVNPTPDLGIIYTSKRINFKMPNKGWKGSGAQMPTAWYSSGVFLGNEVFDASHWNKEYRERFEV